MLSWCAAPRSARSPTRRSGLPRPRAAASTSSLARVRPPGCGRQSGSPAGGSPRSARKSAHALVEELVDDVVDDRAAGAPTQVRCAIGSDGVSARRRRTSVPGGRAGATAGRPVGHRDEVGPDGGERLDRAPQVGARLRRPGREQLERHRGAVGRPAGGRRDRPPGGAANALTPGPRWGCGGDGWCTASRTPSILAEAPTPAAGGLLRRHGARSLAALDGGAIIDPSRAPVYDVRGARRHRLVPPGQARRAPPGSRPGGRRRARRPAWPRRRSSAR